VQPKNSENKTKMSKNYNVRITREFTYRPRITVEAWRTNWAINLCNHSD